MLIRHQSAPAISLRVCDVVRQLMCKNCAEKRGSTYTESKGNLEAPVRLPPDKTPTSNRNPGTKTCTKHSDPYQFSSHSVIPRKTPFGLETVYWNITSVWRSSRRKAHLLTTIPG